MLGKHRKATAFRAPQILEALWRFLRFLNPAGSENWCFARKAQVSIEILLLAGIIIFLSMFVFSYYTRINETTFAMELTKVEVLGWIEAENKGVNHIIEKIDYSLNGNNVDLCIFTLPRAPALEPDPDMPTALLALHDKIKGYGLFPDPTKLYMHHNEDETPAAANCGDFKDNDCDGQVDLADSGC